MQFEGVRIKIRGRGTAWGYFITSDHPLLALFSAVEEEIMTDFSKTKEVLEQYLDTNYAAGAPHTVTFNPKDPIRMVAQGTAEVHIEAVVNTLH